MIKPPQPEIKLVWSDWRGRLLLTLGVAAVWSLFFQFPRWWLLTGIGEAHRPFLDLYALLAACDAVALGINPLLPHNLDPYHRPFTYSEWWFGLGSLGLGRKDTMWLGTLLVGMTLVTAVAMARPRHWRESLSLGLLLVSPAWLLAVNRANQDLVIFLVVSLGLVCFRARSALVHALGVICCAVAAVLKFFPLATVVLLLDFRSRRKVLAGLGIFAVVLLLAWPGLKPALLSAARLAPTPEWLYAFGAPMLLRDFGSTSVIGWLAPAGLLFLWALREAWRDLRAAPSAWPPSENSAEREFMCGAVMLVGVFFLGASYTYKLVFAIWLLPWLWQARPAGAEARWLRLTWALVLGVVWVEGLAAVLLNLSAGFISEPVALGLLKAALVVTQLMTWGLIACLLRFLLIHLGRRARALRLLPGGAAGAARA